MDKHLLEAYKSGNLILFVGAGVSANLNLPDWRELIGEIAKQLEYDPDVFSTYGDFLSLAEFYLISKGGKIGALRSWMDTQWHSPSINIADSQIHTYIATGKFSLIYTTNYDRWIESALQHHDQLYAVIRNVNDLAKLDSGCKQVVKFHGDLHDDSSIVLGESSYFERMEFESPLDIKLRSDILGKSVLFIGYSLSDINIRLLFYKLSKLWKAHGIEKSRPRSFIFSPRPNPVQEAIFADRGMTMITSEIADAGIALEDFLKKLVSSSSLMS